MGGHKGAPNQAALKIVVQKWCSMGPEKWTGRAMLSLISKESALEKASKKAEEDREREANNREIDALFEAFAALPICITLKNNDDCKRSLVNAINGVVVAESNLLFDAKRVLEIRVLPNSGDNYWKILERDEAEKLLQLWTLMSRPYHIVGWDVPSDKEKDGAQEAAAHTHEIHEPN